MKKRKKERENLLRQNFRKSNGLSHNVSTSDTFGNEEWCITAISHFLFHLQIKTEK